MRTLSGMPLDSSGQKIDNRFTPSRREGDRIDGSKLETPANPWDCHLAMKQGACSHTGTGGMAWVVGLEANPYGLDPTTPPTTDAVEV